MIHYHKNPDHYRQLSKKNREKYPEYYKEYQKNYQKKECVRLKKTIYSKTPKGKEINRLSKLKYRYENGGSNVEKEWREKNKEKVSIYKNKYKHSPNGLISAINYTHRRRSWLGSGKVTKEEWEELKLKFNNKCADCKREIKLEMDHINPLSKGGVHHISNIQPLCRECNARKSNKIIGDIMPQQKLWKNY